MINDVIHREGGIVDHSADRGGLTKFGIIQRTLTCYLGRKLSRELAAEIYRRAYYLEPHLDTLPESIRAFLFGCCPDCGAPHVLPEHRRTGSVAKGLFERLDEQDHRVRSRHPGHGGMNIFGMLKIFFRPATELVEVFMTNAEEEAERQHVARLNLGEQDLASLEQSAAELTSQRTSTKWDSFIDGLNRLPRPLITLGILDLFVLAPADPRFGDRACMPNHAGRLWASLNIIIAVYFGGHMQVTRQQMAVKGGALKAVKDIVEARKVLLALADDDEQPQPTIARPLALVASKNIEATPTKNRIVEAWLREKKT